MKKLFALTFVLFNFLTNAQEQQIQELNSCGTEYTVDQNFDQNFEKYYQEQLNIKSKNPVTYYIPIVFHIIHSGEQVGVGSNVSDATVYNTLKALNNHLKNKHNHPSNGNTQIQYVLATKSPSGACSTGINRIDYSTNQSYVQFGNRYSSASNGVDAAAIRALSNWNPTQYYNVWVVNKITSTSNVAAYAYYPSEHGKIHDGTFIAAQYLNESTSGTITHEIGHSLNLMHTFEGSTGSNCPAQINGCGADGDCIADTPPHSKTHNQDLILTAPNICSGDNNSTYKHNYMAYIQDANRKVFTPQQIARMQSAVNFYRSSYLPATNPVFKMTQAPQAQFLINNSDSTFKQTFCIGAPINLTNTSKCFLNTFNDTTVANYTSNWTIKKNGQTVLTTSEPNPTITLTQTGLYSITLVATNNIGSGSYTKTDIIEIISPSSKNYCAPTSFNKGYFGLSINNVKLHFINNSTGIGINDAYTDFSCTHITQAAYDKPNKIDITVSNLNSNVVDNLMVQGYIDYNDNGLFEVNEQILQQLVPNQTNNKLYSFYFTPPTAAIKGKVLRMRIISERTSISTAKLNCTTQFNVGDVEDYGVIFAPSLSKESFEKLNYDIYPNPVSNILNITSLNTDLKTIKIFTITGKLVKELQTQDEQISIDVSFLSTGTYLLNINDTTHKFIKG